jgi:Tfp pilus assembly protein PilF
VAEELYESALSHMRACDFDAARASFESLLAVHPQHVKGWISYAQMSKKSAGRLGKGAGGEAARSVLQRAERACPHSGQVLQAVGLIELQQGNGPQAVGLLRRAVALQPELAPVLEWRAVKQASEQQ